jgi:raffinose/stachyose/melibiose transport system permease protein
MQKKQIRIGWLYLLPLLSVNAFVVFLPAVSNLFLSFTSWSGLGVPKWIGFENYSRLLQDNVVHEAIVRNLIWTLIFLIIPMGLALIGAYMILRAPFAGTFFRLIFFTPYIVSTVVSASVWSFLYSPKLGLTPLLFGNSADTPNLLGNGDTALYAVALANVWQWWGFLMMVFFAAMQSVNPSLYEAAELDGASAFRKLISITIPAIRPTIMFMSLMTVIWSFLIFDYVFIMTGGGPAGKTEVLGTLLYKSAFWSREAGYAAAIGVLMGLISLTVVGLYLTLRKRLKWEI